MNFTEELNKNPIFDTIGQAADAIGVDAYVIGGFVRDIFLARGKKDIDIVCIGSGIELAEKVAQQLQIQQGMKHIHVNFFKNFGTAQIKTEDWEIEFVEQEKNLTALIPENPSSKMALWKTTKIDEISLSMP